MSPFTASSSLPNDLRNPPRTPRPTRRAFTFTEVMFAVVILGIGFIMIAAIFPVAIRQTAQSAEESVAITAAERGMAMIQSRATAAMFPPTALGIGPGPIPAEYHAPFVALGEAYPNLALTVAPGETYPTLTGTVAERRVAAADQWVNVAGDLISTTDARLGFALAYARSGALSLTTTPPTVAAPGSTVRIIAVVAQSRDRPRFNEDDSAAGSQFPRDVSMPRSTPPNNAQLQTQYTENGFSTATLQFKRLRARFLIGQNGAPDQVQFTSDGSNMTTGGANALDGANAVAPGTFLIVADAGNGSPTIVKLDTNPTTNFNARANGRVFRVGNLVSSTANNVVYELVPGQDITSIPLRTGPSITDSSGMDRPPYFNGSFGTGAIVEVLVLGRSLRDPRLPYNQSDNPYVGLPLDIAVYTTTVGLRQ